MNRTSILLMLGLTLLVACRRPAASGAGAAPSQATSGTSAARSSASRLNDLDATPTKTTVLDVQVVRPSSARLTVVRTASGTVKSRRDSSVAAQASGAVSQVLVQEGDRVESGQAVIALDDTSLREALNGAQLQLQNAQINLTQASRNTVQNKLQLQAGVLSAQASFAKAQQAESADRNLFNLGGVSKSELIASQAALAQAQSDLTQAQNALAQNGQGGGVSLPLLRNQVSQAQSSVTQAQSNLERATIRAPFSGVIADIPAVVGEYVQTGATAFRLVDTSALSVDFNVSPEDAASLPAGTPVNLTYGDQKRTGTIKTADRVAGSDRLVPLHVRLDDAPATAQQLPVGASVQVRYRVRLGGTPASLSIPVIAVQQLNGSNIVFVDQGGVAKLTPVGIVAEAGDQAIVSGLEAGQQIISPVPPSLADGSLIHPVKTP